MHSRPNQPICYMKTVHTRLTGAGLEDIAQKSMLHQRTQSSLLFDAGGLLRLAYNRTAGTGGRLSRCCRGSPRPLANTSHCNFQLLCSILYGVCCNTRGVVESSSADRILVCSYLLTRSTRAQIQSLYDCMTPSSRVLAVGSTVL